MQQRLGLNDLNTEHARRYMAITLWQPWASLVAEECKPLEFRSWAPPSSYVGRRIGIHASARKISIVEVRGLLVKLHSNRWRETGLLRERAIPMLEKVKADPEAFPRSAILCTALLGAPLRNAELANRLGIEAMDGFGQERINDSDRPTHSNWGWPLSEVQRLTPYVPAKGMQGFWPWSASSV